MFRTYSGHSSARASNELYRTNLSKGQTGLSVAFDLPTQTGYDSDHPLARGEVGKVGVPISHIDDMTALFKELPLEKMNTSMTINANAAWLLALYVATAERTGADPKKLQGTTQNDIVKEYLSRGTYIFPPEASLKLISDIVAYTVDSIPMWNPTNICSYHLQEAGATPVQEIAYALTTAISVLDLVRSRGDVSEAAIPRIVGRISFFLNSGIRFVEEICKVRAMAELWDEITLERYGVQDAKLRRFRYGVQVNSLGRALQLPAWNEALGLPRPWDQQWSLRIQQILAFESDLLEHEDIFDGSHVIVEKTGELKQAARRELDVVLEMGGTVAAIENAYMKQRLVESQTARARAIENAEITVVGVNAYTNAEPSPLMDGQWILKVDESAEREQVERLVDFRSKRNRADVESAVQNLEDVLRNGGNVMPASIRAAHAGVTTGEWADVLRGLYGEYRAPTGVVATEGSGGSQATADTRDRVHRLADTLGRPLKILVGKPGLDGHSNGAEQIAVKARDVGMEVVYDGIRLEPSEIAASARDEGVHLVGLSILSGSHCVLVIDVIDKLRELGLDNLPVVVGGIIPEEDANKLCQAGVRRVYTPKDFDLTRIMSDIVDVVEEPSPAA
jgi:(2R)-ethylmalonyl-CoA mutase